MIHLGVMTGRDRAPTSARLPIKFPIIAGDDLVERIRKSDYFKPIWGQIDALLDPKTFVGRAPEQVN